MHPLGVVPDLATSPVIIYVQLLDEGTVAFRPVTAEHIGGDQFVIETRRPEDELWEFDSGSTVIGEPRRISGGCSIIAVRLAP